MIEEMVNSLIKHSEPIAVFLVATPLIFTFLSLGLLFLDNTLLTFNWYCNLTNREWRDLEESELGNRLIVCGVVHIVVPLLVSWAYLKVNNMSFTYFLQQSWKN